MKRKNANDSSEDSEMFYLIGGLALVALGAGLLMSHRGVRQAVNDGISKVLPDLQERFMPDIANVGADMQRYLKMKSM